MQKKNFRTYPANRYQHTAFFFLDSEIKVASVKWYANDREKDIIHTSLESCIFVLLLRVRNFNGVVDHEKILMRINLEMKINLTQGNYLNGDEPRYLFSFISYCYENKMKKEIYKIKINKYLNNIEKKLFYSMRDNEGK